MNFLNFGKYKGIVAFIAIFIILNTTVLTLNVVVSLQIDDDAVGVNLSGRQRMLSQRMMKSLLNAEQAADQPADALAELTLTKNLFESTLIAFDQGGAATGADGSNVTLGSVSNDEARAAVNAANVIWKPYKTRLEMLLNAEVGSEAYQSAMASAITYGTQNNLKLLKLMNDLTVALERVAKSKATYLRWIQFWGILIALGFFGLIVVRFIGQLRASDDIIEMAQQETREILETVNEGLFLVDSDLVIGDQHSRELTNIFNRDDIAGTDFESLLKDLVSEKDMKTTQSFIKLLFKPTVNQNLIGDLNPLSEVEIHISSPQGGYNSKFLSFSFSRVINDGDISHVLVTVVDITEQVQLTKELAVAKTQNEQQLELLSSLLNTNSELLPMFLDNAFSCFNQINNTLREPSKSQAQHIQKANKIYALVHNFKGEASALNLDQFVDEAHAFEDELERLKEQRELGGKHFLALTVMLNSLISKTEQANELAQKLRRFTQQLDNTEASGPVTMDWNHLNKLALTIADKQGKQISVTHSGLNEAALSKTALSVVNSISIQLLRNAVTHGIETPKDRAMSQKDPIGNVDIRLAVNSDGNYVYEFIDDGAGLDLERIREAAVTRGLVSERDALGLDKKRIISLIFSPELSTRDNTDTDAGRGMGMHSVRSLIQQLNAKITIGSRRGLGCKFTIIIPKQTATSDTAA